MQFYLWLWCLYPGVWLNCLVPAKFVWFSISIPQKGLGSTTPLNQAISKIKAMQYALKVIENNQANVPNIKKSTLMQQ